MIGYLRNIVSSKVIGIERIIIVIHKLVTNMVVN